MPERQPIKRPKAAFPPLSTQQFFETTLPVTHAISTLRMIVTYIRFAIIVDYHTKLDVNLLTLSQQCDNDAAWAWTMTNGGRGNAMAPLGSNSKILMLLRRQGLEAEKLKTELSQQAINTKYFLLDTIPIEASFSKGKAKQPGAG